MYNSDSKNILKVFVWGLQQWQYHEENGMVVFWGVFLSTEAVECVFPISAESVGWQADQLLRRSSWRREGIPTSYPHHYRKPTSDRIQRWKISNVHCVSALELIFLPRPLCWINDLHTREGRDRIRTVPRSFTWVMYFCCQCDAFTTVTMVTRPGE